VSNPRDSRHVAKVALVTGANQGLGFALVEGLATQMGEGDVVYLTGRDRERVEQAATRVRAAKANVRVAVMDVRDSVAVGRLAREIESEHGGVDILFSNHYARVLPDDQPAQVVAGFVDTNNLGTTRVLRAFAPILRPGGRLLVVASSLGTLNELAAQLHGRFDTGTLSLEDLDATMLRWRDAVIDASAAAEGWPEFINIPSKVGQVAAVRVLARERRQSDGLHGTLIAAVCPGMIDTAASRPWFDMSGAQTPTEAARALLELALEQSTNKDFYGELVRFGAVVPWEPVAGGSLAARVRR
jgi:carbonyl reductase 1